MSISAKPWDSAGGGASSDTLNDVTGRGATTGNSIQVGGLNIAGNYAMPSADGSVNQVLQTDGSGSLSFTNISVTGGLTYKGKYYLSSPADLSNAVQGDFYIIQGVGMLYGKAWSTGDHLVVNDDMGGSVSNGKIDKVDNTDLVTSVNALTGPVVLNGTNVDGDYTPSNYSTNAGSDKIEKHLEGIDNKFGTLGTASTQNVGTSASNVVQLDGSARLPAVDGSQLTGITATDATKLAIANNLSDLNSASTARTNLGLGTASTSASTDFLAVSNNLSDLNNAGTARTNLGLGTASTKDTGVANGNVIVADATGLPVIDGSQLTGVTGTDATKLAIANNLSDLNSASTARTNLGLGTASTSASTDFLAVSNNLSDLNNAGTARTNLGLVIGTDVAPIASPALTGSPTAPTQSASDNSTKVATTAYVDAAVVAGGGLSSVVQDTSPELGGNLDVLARSIVSSSNRAITLTPDGSGLVEISGNATSGSGQIKLNCEQNTHGIKLKSPPHSATADYTLVFPDDLGTSGKVLTTNGGGGGGSTIGTLTWETVSTTDTTKLAILNNLSDLDNAGTARTNLGLVIGTNVQAFDPGLTSIAGLTTAADKMIFTDGSDSYAVTGLTSAGRALLDDADASAQRTTLGLVIGTNVLGDVVDDTSPQLGGDLDLNSNKLTSASNGNVELTPHGTGHIKLGGNTNPAEVRFFDEAGTNYIALKAPADADLGGDYTLTLPVDDGTPDQVLKTNGSGVLSWVAQSGGGSAPVVTEQNTTAALSAPSAGVIEEIYTVDSGSSVTLTLVSSATCGEGFKYNIKRLGAGAVVIQCATNQFIDHSGQTSFTISAQYDSVTLVANGTSPHTSWLLI